MSNKTRNEGPSESQLNYLWFKMLVIEPHDTRSHKHVTGLSAGGKNEARELQTLWH
jgi:hypothetical protein